MSEKSFENNKSICQGIFLPRNWIYLHQNYFLSYVYLKDRYKTEYNLEFQGSVQNLLKKDTFYQVLLRNTLK